VISSDLRQAMMAVVAKEREGSWRAQYGGWMDMDGYGGFLK
jgi:hypothetical protein